jgi:hypothetical protein
MATDWSEVVNYKARAKTAVGRSMPQQLMRTLLGDDWIASIETEVARALRRVQREAYRHGIRRAANEIGERGMDPELRSKLIDGVLALAKDR